MEELALKPNNLKKENKPLTISYTSSTKIQSYNITQLQLADTVSTTPEEEVMLVAVQGSNLSNIIFHYACYPQV